VTAKEYSSSPLYCVGDDTSGDRGLSAARWSINQPGFKALSEKTVKVGYDLLLVVAQMKACHDLTCKNF
jgi:hypothetical protein